MAWTTASQMKWLLRVGRSYRIGNGNHQRFCCETAKSLLQPPVGGGRPSFSMLLRSTGDAGDDSAGYGAFGHALDVLWAATDHGMKGSYQLTSVPWEELPWMCCGRTKVGEAAEARGRLPFVNVLKN